MELVLNIVLWVVAVISLYFAVFWLLVFFEGGSLPHKKKKLDSFPFVTIVIPAYNECEREDTGEVRGVVDTTIKHAMSLDYPQDRYEVIVVNDGSTDDTPRVIESAVKQYAGRNILYINKCQNQGKHAAMNDAIAIARGEFLVSLDGDSLLTPDILKGILPYFVSDDIGCVCPNMTVMDPRTFLEKVQWYEYIINMFYKKLMSHLDCVHVAPGPFSVFRTEVLKKIGGFRSAYNTEDLEITYRLQKNHYRIVQALDVGVQTKAPSTWRAFLRQRKRWFIGATLNTLDYRSMLFNKSHGDFGFIQLPLVLASPILAVVILSTLLAYTLKGQYTLWKELWVIDFDVWHYVRSMQFNFNLLDIDFITLIASICMLSITVMVLVASFRTAKERLFAMDKVIPLYFFVSFYYLLMGFSWVASAYDIVRRKKLRW